MRRNYLTVIIVFATITLAVSQDDDAAAQNGMYKHTLGLNATGLIENLFNSEPDSRSNPYLILYNYDMGKTNLRVSLGPEYLSSTETHEGFTDSQERTVIGIDARLGVGFDIVDEKRWKVMAGADIVGKYFLDETTNDTGFDKITDEDEEWNVGGGPFVQVLFFISPRISIATETGLYFRHFETTTTELFENFPDFNNQLSKTTGSELDFILPTSIFLQFHF